VIVAVLVGLGLLFAFVSRGTSEPMYAYSDVLADAAAGDVESIEQDRLYLYVYFRDGLAVTSQVANDSINVYAEVCAVTGNPVGPKCPIYYAAVADQVSEWVGLLVTAFLPLLLIGVFIYLMMRQAQKTQKKPFLVKLADPTAEDETKG
jgi:ATP-dependent Zn protease